MSKKAVDTDKKTDSISKETREILSRIEEKKKYWSGVFSQNGIRFIETLNGFIIDHEHHKNAMRLILNESPLSAETAALFFNYDDLSSYDDSEESVGGWEWTSK